MNEEIISLNLTERGTLVVVIRTKSFFFFANGKPGPDRVVCRTYGATPDGQIVVVSEVEGKHTPAYVVAETIVFP